MRLIDADVLEPDADYDDGEFWAYSKVQVDNAPTIEPKRKVGKWEQIEVSYLSDMDDEMKESLAIASMFCPRCKRYHNKVYLYGSPTHDVNFCPYCGAKNVNICKDEK